MEMTFPTIDLLELIYQLGRCGLSNEEHNLLVDYIKKANKEYIFKKDAGEIKDKLFTFLEYVFKQGE